MCTATQSPATYELRLHGHLDQSWSQWFGQPHITHQADGTTRMLIHVTDQTELHGVLVKVRDLGLGLIALNQVVPTATDDRSTDPDERRTRPPA